MERVLVRARKRNGRYQNQEETQQETLGALFRFIREGGRGFWPKWVEIERFAPPPERAPGESILTSFINHSTALVQLGDVNFLTDPIYSAACGPFGRIGPRRRHAPGVAFDDLPPIDLVLISHDHYDHLDAPTVKRLEARSSPLFVVPLGNKRRLRRWGVKNVVELDWWESVKHRDVTIHFTPAQHFSGRWLHDRDRSLWGSFVVESPRGNVYFAGDTGLGPHFAEIGERFKSFELSLIPIGAYLPRWFMRPVHIDPAEAVEAHQLLRSKVSVGIHHGTFPLANDAHRAPIDDLEVALEERGVSRDAFRVLAPGEPLEIQRGALESRAEKPSDQERGGTPS